MQSKCNSGNRVETDPYGISPSIVYSEPWWHGTGYNSITPSLVRGNASDSSSLEQSIDGQSRSDGGLNEEDDDASKAPQGTAVHSDGNYGLVHQSSQHVASTVPPRSGGNLTQPPQLELVGHSIACASNPYADPYYGGLMTAYGQPLLHPQLLNMHNARMPLPLDMAQEPIYVNAKQYHGILRRRQSRAKAELEKKLIKDRKPYLHESRHQHAMRRARGSGGRFAKKSDADNVKQMAEDMVKGSGSAISSLRASSLGSEPLPCKPAISLRSRHQEARRPELQETCEGHEFVDDDMFGNHGNLQASAYESHSAERKKPSSCQ